MDDFSKDLTRRQFIKLAALLALSSQLKPPFVLAESGSPESRAIFDEGLSWTTKNSADRLLGRIQKAGFNVFMSCVWHGRGTAWPSKLAPWDNHYTPVAGFDPFDYLVRRAPLYGIEVHPWFTVALRQREFLQTFYDEGTPSEAFDVHREAFRDFIVALMLEVISKYPVQGINLDYVRAKGICTSLSCVEDYKRETGRDLLSDIRMRRLPGFDTKPLIAWQEKAVGDIVRRVSQQARAVNRNIVVSMDAAPWYSPILLEGQNSIQWADQGLVDVVYSMDYRDPPDFQAVRTIQSKMKRPGALVMLCGDYTTVGPAKTVVPKEANRVVQVLREARSIGFANGVGLYLYSMLGDEQVRLLRSDLFQSQVKTGWVRANVSETVQ